MGVHHKIITIGKRHSMPNFEYQSKKSDIRFSLTPSKIITNKMNILNKLIILTKNKNTEKILFY